MPWFDEYQTYINPYYLDVTPDVRVEMNARAAYYASKTRSVGRPVSKNIEWPYRKMTWAYILSNYTTETNPNPIVLGLDSREKKEQNLMSNEKGQLTLYGQQRNTPIYPLLTGLEISNEGQRGSLLKGKFSFTFFPELTPTGFELQFMQEALFTPGRRVQISFGWTEAAEIYKTNKLEFVGVIFGFNWSFNANMSITAEVQVVSPSGIAVGLSGDQSVQDDEDGGVDPAGRDLPPSTNLLSILDRDLREARNFPENNIDPSTIGYIPKDRFSSKRFNYVLINLPISKGSSYMESSADNLSSTDAELDDEIKDGDGYSIGKDGNIIVNDTVDNKIYADPDSGDEGQFIKQYIQLKTSINPRQTVDNGASINTSFSLKRGFYENNNNILKDSVIPWIEDRMIDNINDVILKNPARKPNSLELIMFKNDLERLKDNISTQYTDSMNNNYKGGIKIGKLKALVGSRKDDSEKFLPLRHEDKIKVMDKLIAATRINELNQFFEEYFSFAKESSVFLLNKNGSSYHDNERWPSALVFGGIDEEPDIRNTQGLLTKIDNIKKETFDKFYKGKGYGNTYQEIPTDNYKQYIDDFQKKLKDKLQSGIDGKLSTPYSDGPDTDVITDDKKINLSEANKQKFTDAINKQINQLQKYRNSVLSNSQQNDYPNQDVYVGGFKLSSLNASISSLSREDKILKIDSIIKLKQDALKTGEDKSSNEVPIFGTTEKTEREQAAEAGKTERANQDNLFPEPINKTYWYVTLGDLVAFANNTINTYESELQKQKPNSIKNLFGLFELRATNNEAQYIKEVKSAYPIDVYFGDVEMGTYGSFSPFSTLYPDFIRQFYPSGSGDPNIQTDVINLGQILIGVDYIRKTYKSFIHGTATNMSFRNITNFFDEIIKRINAASGETYQLSCMLFEEPERLTSILELKPKNPAEKSGTNRRALISIEDSNLAFKHTKTLSSNEEITSEDIIDGVVRPFMFSANVMKPLMKSVSVTSRPSKEAASAAYIAARGEETYQNRGKETDKAKPMNLDTTLAFPHFKDIKTYDDLQAKNLDSKLKEEFLAVSEGFNERWSERYRGALVKMKRLTYDRSTIVGCSWLNRAIYPIELTITIDGINGFKFGDVLKTTMIPAHYNDKWDMVFTVTKILHKVTPSGWDTTLYTAARLSLEAQLTGKDAV